MVSDYRSEETRLLKSAEEFKEKAEQSTGANKAYYYRKAADIEADAKKASMSRARIKQAFGELDIAKKKFPDVFED